MTQLYKSRHQLSVVRTKTCPLFFKFFYFGAVLVYFYILQVLNVFLISSLFFCRSANLLVAFLRACGGMGVLVKEEFDPERKPETHATFSLRNPDEVQDFLAKLVAHAKSAGDS